MRELLLQIILVFNNRSYQQLKKIQTNKISSLRVAFKLKHFVKYVKKTTFYSTYI